MQQIAIDRNYICLTRDELKSVIKGAINGLIEALKEERDMGRLDFKINPRDIAVAITHLETALMWAIKSLYSEDEQRKN